MDPVYLDCAATSPVEPAIAELVMRYLTVEFGNAGSRTHEFGNRAKIASQRAKDQIAMLVGAQRDEVVFTSGATESNNLAVLGLREHGEVTGKKHVITSTSEHKAVLEPCQELERVGFTVTYLAPNKDGVVTADALSAALRPDTLLVTLMHVNNETGAIQPLAEYASVLASHEAFWHVDAAQGFGKLLSDLRNSRIDLISVSGHKIYAPQGIGALICRRRGFDRLPIRPLAFGGGQERGLRPGTLPVHLAVALGAAAEIANKQQVKRRARCIEIRRAALKALTTIGGKPTVPEEHSISSTLSISFLGVDAEALMVAAKDLVAISNGAACTSHSYKDSHVLAAMNLPVETIRSTVRISWCHLTPDVDWDEFARIVVGMRS